jgi:hypothetical protein
MPNKTTVLRWLDEPSLSATYTRARELQADGYADEINDIANKVMLGEIDPSAAKVAIDAKNGRLEIEARHVRRRGAG